MSASSGDSRLTRRSFRGEKLEARSGIFRGLPLVGDEHLFYRLFNDFDQEVDATGAAAIDLDWAAIDSPTLSLLDDNATPDPETGVLHIEMADDSDETDGYIQTAKDLLKPAAGKSFAVEARVYLEETTADAGNFIFGFHEEFADGVLKSAGAGLNTTSIDAIVILTTDGASTWDLQLANAAAATTPSRTAIADVVTDAWHRLGLRVDCGATTGDAVVSAYVDGVKVSQQSVSMVSLESMKLGFGVRNGTAEGYDMYIDYVRFIGER